MTVYLLLEWYEYEGDWPVAVFSTRQLAEDFQARLRPKETRTHGWRIEEMVVDEEPPLNRFGRMPMRNLDGYLSRKAQEVWPNAIVWKDQVAEVVTFTLERPGVEPLGLGRSFGEAKQSVAALRRQKEASREAQTG